MANRRTPPGLKVMRPLAPAPAAVDVRVGGIGLDWAEVPAVLDETARAEWARLGKVYEHHPVRFREGDRALLAAFCIAWSVYVLAAAELAAAGVLVPGRSVVDKGRDVKSPAMTVWVQAGTQLRHLASALGLSPDARGRSGIRDDDPEGFDPDSDLLTGGNPFKYNPSRLLS